MTEPTPRRSSFLATIAAVAWSFFGVRKSRDHDADMRTLNPVAVIVTGVALAACFVVVLLLIVHWVVSSAST